jgi:hypothetical protein
MVWNTALWGKLWGYAGTGVSAGSSGARGRLTITTSLRGRGVGAGVSRSTLSQTIKLTGQSHGGTNTRGKPTGIMQFTGRSTGSSNVANPRTVLKARSSGSSFVSSPRVAIQTHSLTARSVGSAGVSAPEVVPPLSPPGSSVGSAGARGTVHLSGQLAGLSAGHSGASGQLVVLHCQPLTISPTIAAPNDLITVTGTVLDWIQQITIETPDNWGTNLFVNNFITRTPTEITFKLPAHADSFYTGPATLTFYKFPNYTGPLPESFEITYVMRPVMVSFVGGPHDGEVTVTAPFPELHVSTGYGPSGTESLHIYSDYGTYRSGEYGVNVWADYNYTSTLSWPPPGTQWPPGVDPNDYSAHYLFSWVPQSTGTHPQGVGGLNIVQVPDNALPTSFQLTSFRPDPASVGAVVTVNGGGLLAIHQLDINGLMIGIPDVGIGTVIPATSFLGATNSSITFQLPNMPPGAYEIHASGVNASFSNSLNFTVTLTSAGISTVAGAGVL